MRRAWALLFAAGLLAGAARGGQGGEAPKPDEKPAAEAQPEAAGKPEPKEAPPAKPEEPKPAVDAGSKATPKAEPKKAPAAESAPLRPAPAGTADSIGAEKFVEGLYARLEGQRPDLPGMVLAIEPGLLLERVVAGLAGGTRPPEVWMAAARKRLAENRSEAVSAMFPRETWMISPQVVRSEEEGPDRSVVTVRFYSLEGRTGRSAPSWHLVEAVRTAGGWRVAEIVVVDPAERLSSWALAQVTDLGQEDLPVEGGGVLLVLAAKTVAAGLLAALLLGLGAHFLLVRPSAGKPKRGRFKALTWLAVLGPALAGVAFFFSGLMAHLDRDGAVDEIARRGASRRRVGEAVRALGSGKLREALALCEDALKTWGRNPAAMALGAKLRVMGGGGKGAEDYLEALTDIEAVAPTALLELARLYERQKNWRAAARSLLGFVKKVGPCAFSYCRAAQYFARAGDDKNADWCLLQAGKAEDIEKDHLMLLARASVRAGQKRPREVIADFKRILAPYERDPAGFVQMCANIFGLVRSGQFDGVIKDPGFRAYMGELQTRFTGIIQRAGGGGGSN